MSRTADNILIDTSERIFYISDDIDHSSIGKMCFNLLFLLQQDEKNEKEKRDFKREPISIYINSNGGDVYDMWGLIDIIEKSKTPIHTYCTGYAMSAAFLIFLSGHKRFAFRHSTFMYHQLYYHEFGRYKDAVEYRAEIDNTNKWFEEYVIERTKITQEYVDNVRDKKIDVYIHAEEALRLGIIESVM